MKRTATAIWQGGLKDGKGALSTESNVLSQTPYSFSTRFEGARGTNPEELIAAAHAGCFSMALSAELGKAGMTAETIRTNAALTMERLDSGWNRHTHSPRRDGELPGADRGEVDTGPTRPKPAAPSRACSTRKSRWTQRWRVRSDVRFREGIVVPEPGTWALLLGALARLRAAGVCSREKWNCYFLELPACTIMWIEAGVRSLLLVNRAGLVVPLERLTGETNGDQSEQRHLRERTAVIEIGNPLYGQCESLQSNPRRGL